MTAHAKIRLLLVALALLNVAIFLGRDLHHSLDPILRALGS